MAEILAQAIRMHLRTLPPPTPGEPATVSGLRGALSLHERDVDERTAERLEEGLGQVARTQQDLLRVRAANAEARRRTLAHVASRAVDAAVAERVGAIITGAGDRS